MRSTAGTGEPKRLAENGDYFLKRDRNKARTIGIYTCKARQTVRVADTRTSDPQQAELALARFVLTNAEAMARARKGNTACDLPVTEALALYFVARQEFHEANLKRIQGLIAASGESDTEMIRAFYAELKSARKAKQLEVATIRNVAESVEKCWEQPPKASDLNKPGQLHYVKVMRARGYKDTSIRTWLVRIFTALKHCVDEERLDVMPARVRADKWMLSEAASTVAYTMPEMKALFNAAAKDAARWKFINLETHGMRPMTAVEMHWLQVTLGEDPRMDLNPPGKRRTKKRRPIIPVCPSLAAEMATWTRDHERVISTGTGRSPTSQQLFRQIKADAGITRGSAKSLRKTMRTYCALKGAPDPIADMFFGHAGIGSATGDAFYKDKIPENMTAVVHALEAFYTEIRPGVSRAIALPKGAEICVTNCVSNEISEDQPAPSTALEAITAGLRVKSVTEKLLSR